MKNIDKLREMSVEELATFLDDCAAEVPEELCEHCASCQSPVYDVCKYKNEIAAWKDWLEMEAS